MSLELLNICRTWSAALDPFKETQARIDFFKKEMPALLFNAPLFLHLMEQIATGKPYPDTSRPEMFENEILLYTDPRRRFSLRIFLFGPGEFTSVHDHSSWGLTGTVFGPLEVVKYERLDDGTRPNFAELTEKERLSLTTGEVDFTPLLEKGIHKTGNPDRNAAICMVSIYGSPIRRLYVNGFDVEKNSVVKLYGPRLKKRMLAKQLIYDS